MVSSDDYFVKKNWDTRLVAYIKLYNTITCAIVSWKDYAGHEVNFVVRAKEQVKELIQVTYATSLAEVAERETKGLIKAARELKCSNLTVVTWEVETHSVVDGLTINYVPLWRWL
ncbi:ATP-binding protein [Candidatus Saganbacteria bacterium]|nr:ATP-binding protein [Candidatus Saganbacteria bacterium]